LEEFQVGDHIEVLVSGVPRENMDVPSHPSWHYIALPFEFLRCTLYNKPANVNQKKKRGQCVNCQAKC
jgi:hypothetical protein